MDNGWSCGCDCESTENFHDNSCLVGAVHLVANALRLLGNADALTSMGGLEGLGKAVQDGFGEIAKVLRVEEVSDVVEEVYKEGY